MKIYKDIHAALAELLIKQKMELTEYLLQRMEEQMTKGAVLFMKGLPTDTTLEEVKTFFGEFGQVAWVEFVSGDDKVSGFLPPIFVLFFFYL